MIRKRAAAIILGGGFSSRMGYPKPFLRIGRKFLAQRLVDTYLAAGISPILVLNSALFDSEFITFIDQLDGKCKLVKNHLPALDRCYSIKLGFDEISQEDCCFIQNIDNPEIDKSLLERMIRGLKKGAYVVPSIRNRSGHPLLIDGTIMSRIRNLPDTGWVLKEQLTGFRRIRIPCGSNDVLLNLNTPADYVNYIKTIKTDANRDLCSA